MLAPRDRHVGAVLACSLGLLGVWAPRAAAQDTIEVVPVADNIHMLVGRGGNIGVLTGEKGAYLIDDQFEDLTEAIVAAVRSIDDRSIRCVINTHWHGDHTGGNKNLGERHAMIVAHDNVRTRLSKDQVVKDFDMYVPAQPEAGLPVVTFTETMTIHENGEEIHIHHMPHAHTDGDSIVYFRKANVVHMGDLFFNGMYPYIDLDSGGGVDGMITGIERALEMTNEKTKYIPGHGPLGDRAALLDSLDMLLMARAEVGALVEDGMSKDDVKAADPLADLNEKWGGGVLNPEKFTEILYDSLSDAPDAGK